MVKRAYGELRGMKVIGAGGRIVGEVDDIELDVTTWRMASLVVRVQSDALAELGLAKPFWSHARLKVPVLQVSGATDVVILHSSVADLAELVAAADAEQG